MQSKLKHNFTIFILFYKSCVASHFFTTPELPCNIHCWGVWLVARSSGFGVWCQGGKHHLIVPSLFQQRRV